MNIEYILAFLKSLDIPVAFGWFNQDVKTTHLSFLKLTEKPIFFNDNDFEYTNDIYQFDLWAIEENPYKYVAPLKALLKTNGFKFIETQQLPEKETGVYHIAIRYRYQQIEE